jgi:hypothetical protein
VLNRRWRPASPLGQLPAETDRWSTTTQIIEVGSGLPGPGPVHEIARQAQLAARVVYADHDPVVVAHARALLAVGRRGGVAGRAGVAGGACVMAVRLAMWLSPGFG